MANRHAGGDGMGVDDEIRNDSLRSPGHVLLCVRDANSSLLAMPTSELIAHLGNSDRAYLPKTAIAESSLLPQLRQS